MRCGPGDLLLSLGDKETYVFVQNRNAGYPRFPKLQRFELVNACITLLFDLFSSRRTMMPIESCDLSVTSVTFQY